jgi:hypothetical protein
MEEEDNGSSFFERLYGNALGHFRPFTRECPVGLMDFFNKSLATWMDMFAGDLDTELDAVLQAGLKKDDEQDLDLFRRSVYGKTCFDLCIKYHAMKICNLLLDKYKLDPLHCWVRLPPLHEAVLNHDMPMALLFLQYHRDTTISPWRQPCRRDYGSFDPTLFFKGSVNYFGLLSVPDDVLMVLNPDGLLVCLAIQAKAALAYSNHYPVPNTFKPRWGDGRYTHATFEKFVNCHSPTFKLKTIYEILSLLIARFPNYIVPNKVIAIHNWQDLTDQHLSIHPQCVRTKYYVHTGRTLLSMLLFAAPVRIFGDACNPATRETTCAFNRIIDLLVDHGETVPLDPIPDSVAAMGGQVVSRLFNGDIGVLAEDSYDPPVNSTSVLIRESAQHRSLFSPEFLLHALKRSGLPEAEWTSRLRLKDLKEELSAIGTMTLITMSKDIISHDHLTFWFQLVISHLVESRDTGDESAVLPLLTALVRLLLTQDTTDCVYYENFDDMQFFKLFSGNETTGKNTAVISTASAMFFSKLKCSDESLARSISQTLTGYVSNRSFSKTVAAFYDTVACFFVALGEHKSLSSRLFRFHPQPQGQGQEQQEQEQQEEEWCGKYMEPLEHLMATAALGQKSPRILRNPPTPFLCFLGKHYRCRQPPPGKSSLSLFGLCRRRLYYELVLFYHRRPWLQFHVSAQEYFRQQHVAEKLTSAGLPLEVVMPELAELLLE